MLHRKKAKAEVFQKAPRRENDPLEHLRYEAACKLCVWHEHEAGGGSFYITIGDGLDDSFGVSLKLRFANHDNTSAQYRAPDFNFVNRNPIRQELQEIVEEIQYPRLCKKTAFAKHVGLTVPKLKKLLTPECLEFTCENEDYPNSFTEYVVVPASLKSLEAEGITKRIPVQQELYTCEDYTSFE